MILSCLRKAAHHAQQVEAILFNDYRISQVQIDGLWTYMGTTGLEHPFLTLPRKPNIVNVIFHGALVTAHTPLAPVLHKPAALA